MTNTETNTIESSVSDTVAAIKGIPTRDNLMETLRKEVLEVTFKKLNGDERKMPCTLIASFLPKATKDDAITQKKVREVSDKVCAVWAVESKGYRSFRYDRVTKVEVVDKADYKVRFGTFWDNAPDVGDIK
jgi:hypothetical protein|tara:strand:- start:45 stop:437 length:393 start_codon:yes stop_codon:yes gene_type:complete